MGSFNRICAVSNTPIMRNQKARVFFLVVDVADLYYYKERKGFFKTSLSESHCYPYENYQIIGYPLLAKYGENCLFEFEDEDMVNLNLDVLNSVFHPNKIDPDKNEHDYNSSHDFLDIDFLTDIDLVQNMILSGSLRINSVHGVSSVVTMAIHEDIYQQLILKDGWSRGSFLDKKQDFQEIVKETMDKYIHSDNLIISERDKMMFDLVKTRLLKDNDKTIEEVTKEYSENLKRFGNYDESYDQREMHHTLTFFKRDIHKYDYPQKIIEANLGALWTSNWFEKNNLAFHAPMTSSADNDNSYAPHIKRLRDIESIVNNLKTPHDEYSETLALKEVVVKSLVLTRQELESKLKSWFDADSDALVEMEQIINKIIDNQISSFTIGDNSEFDTFSSNYDLFSHDLNGVEIIFDF